MKIWLNDFTRISLKNIKLKRMQAGDVRIGKNFDGGQSYEKSPILDIDIADIKTNKVILKNFNNLFSQRQGYVEMNNELYYKDCNLVANTSKNEIYYQGKLKDSKLYVVFYDVGLDLIKIEILTSNAFLLESRNRLTRLDSFEGILNDIILIASVHKNIIPLHCSAVKLNSPKDSQIEDYKTCVLMGLPNTGKTTTALNLIRRQAKLISEDIAYIDLKTGKIYSAPLTSDVIIPHITNDFKIDDIFFLQYKTHENKVEKLHYDVAYNLLSNMCVYEFNWDQNLIIKGLLISGYMIPNEINQHNILEKYYKGLQEIAKNTNCYLVSGERREEWDEIVISSSFS